MSDISFSVKEGQKIAIVGATGAGKTTLINLLMRFYEIGGGTILLDGVDTHSLSRAGLRQAFGMVLQDTWLFEGTIAENIAYGKPNASREEIIAAAKAARADFLSVRCLRDTIRFWKRCGNYFRRTAPAPYHRQGHALRSCHPDPG